MAIQIDTAKVREIADELEKLNKDLRAELNTSQELIDGLEKYWDSTSYRESKSAYHTFADKYFDEYEKIITSYVTFLRENVAKGYEQTEKENTELASAFK